MYQEQIYYFYIILSMIGIATKRVKLKTQLSYLISSYGM